jgi:hypothetical protein
MTKLHINDTNLSAANKYIATQLESKSWWPKEQPHLASEEFASAQSSPVLLNAWCEKWLDSGQVRLLNNALADAGDSVA